MKKIAEDDDIETCIYCLSLQEADLGHCAKEASRTESDLPREPRRCQRRAGPDQEEQGGLKGISQL